MIIFCVVIFSTNCQAGDVNRLEDIIGNWYDTNGNLALTISKDYSINGCKILNCELFGFTNYVAGIRYDLKIIAVEKTPYVYNSWEFKYKNDGFDVQIVGDRVFSIKIYDYSNRKFDISGLSARDSEESYKRFYKPKAYVGIRGSVFYIGNGELIVPPNKYNNCATLTVDQS